MPQIEKTIDGNTLIIEGEAYSTLVSIGSHEYESEYETRWHHGPTIMDCYDKDFNDVILTEDQEKEIIDGLDINDFVI